MAKLLKLFFTSVISAIFIFQNAAAAQTISYNDYVVQEYSKALVSGMKYKDVFGKIKVNGPRDKELLKNILETYGEKQVPVPVVNGNVLTFTYDDTKLEVEFVDYLHEKIKVNGYEADFSKYKSLSEKIEYAARVLKKKKQYSYFGIKNSLLMSLFQVNEAVAIAPLLIYGGILLVNSVAWGRVVYVWNNNGKLDVYDQMIAGIVTEANKCKKINIDLGSFDDVTSSDFSCERINEFKIKIGDQECFTTANHASHTLTDSMKACCAKNKKECTQKYEKSFSLPVSDAPSATSGSGSVYRSN